MMTTDVSIELRPDGAGHGRPVAPGPELAVQRAADVVAEPVRWVCEGHLALGRIGRWPGRV